MADEEKKETVEQPLETPEENIVNAIPEGKVDTGKRIVAFLIDFMDQRSIGKKVMKIRPVTLEGNKLELVDSVKRNWMFALGPLAIVPIIGWFIIFPAAVILVIIEVILTLTDKEGRRFGDKMAKTRVIEVAE